MKTSQKFDYLSFEDEMHDDSKKSDIDKYQDLSTALGSHRLHWNKAKYLGIGNLLVFGAIFVMTLLSHQLLVSRSIRNEVDYQELTVTVSNEYSSQNLTMFAYPFLDDALLVEPYRDTLLSIEGRSLSDKCQYSWELQGLRQNNGSYSGVFENFQSYIYDVQQTGEYDLRIFDDCDCKPSIVLTKKVWVKYVRRELTTLSDADREEFLDAYVTLWKVNTKEGKKIYGMTNEIIVIFFGK
jgi:hypothetical protein